MEFSKILLEKRSFDKKKQDRFGLRFLINMVTNLSPMQSFLFCQLPTPNISAARLVVPSIQCNLVPI
eukprot:c43094_g1_i1 orf=3-200(-)